MFDTKQDRFVRRPGRTEPSQAVLPEEQKPVLHSLKRTKLYYIFLANFELVRQNPALHSVQTESLPSPAIFLQINTVESVLANYTFPHAIDTVV